MKTSARKARNAKVYGQVFWKFFDRQSIKIRERILWTIRLVQDLEIVPEKYLKHLGYETFKLGAMLLEMRKEQNLTQQQLADKCGTTKTYISRIENDASDIRLSTLNRIVRDGLGAHLILNVSK